MHLGCICDPGITLLKYLTDPRTLLAASTIQRDLVSELVCALWRAAHKSGSWSFIAAKDFEDKQIEAFCLHKQLQRRSTVLEMIEIYLVKESFTCFSISADSDWPVCFLAPLSPEGEIHTLSPAQPYPGETTRIRSFPSLALQPHFWPALFVVHVHWGTWWKMRALLPSHLVVFRLSEFSFCVLIITVIPHCLTFLLASF